MSSLHNFYSPPIRFFYFTKKLFRSIIFQDKRISLRKEGKHENKN
nr:MAG TPA: hypothetical protein [Caudoviricetes sp.]